ncbi:hypothetical protein PENSPDRAFT_668324 [Peniophora sp. CONT]|nr:hypothetical protein PENSPDRAFT_668324 [Peniophora sp. CONT]
MALRAGSSQAPPSHATEFDILKHSHRFLRDEEEAPATWNDQLAAKYYASLFREFAVCDLKHYKSGNFALRWRTEDEVISGAGERSCGNTRCEQHTPPEDDDAPPTTALSTLELPFAYVEQGQAKSALVKVVLCARCVKKLMWKRNKLKEAAAAEDGEEEGPQYPSRREGEKLESAPQVELTANEDGPPMSRGPRRREEQAEDRRTRRRSSRSRSPRREPRTRRPRSP